ncbi:hypothetical protein WAB15_31170 [Streptomyces sirii]|uniref:Uncharacterized protein n=1 Tax=Streptomyces sirii TaxID=3127701 RepID=A0ABZ2R0Q0_9ACTN
MQVPLAVGALVTADQLGGVELGEVVFDAQRAVFGAQGPQQAGDDGGLVAEPAVVVCLGEQAEERPLGGQGDRREGLRVERLGLDGADTGDVDRPPSSQIGGREFGGAGGMDKTATPGAQKSRVDSETLYYFRAGRKTVDPNRRSPNSAP